MKNMIFVIMFGVLFIIPSISFAASVEKADMLNKYGLIQESKKELIDVIFEKSNDESKSQAYYLLGNISFDENKISLAIEAWRTLIKNYPNSKESAMVKEKIDELAEIVGETTKEKIENSIALSYLRHADFWSKNKEDIFMIDSSWIPKVEAAIKWYDKVIKEFPNSAAASIAYQDKMRTILGWKDSGQYGENFGIRKSAIYIPQLIDTFQAFEKEYPNAPTLQAFRYQIAQVYWSKKNWDKTREWLNIIIKESGENDSFYKDLAERRLQKIEY